MQMTCELRPTFESVLARNDELRVGEHEASVRDLFRREPPQTWVPLSNPSQGLDVRGLPGVEEILRLLLVLVGIGTRRERLCIHDDLPFIDAWSPPESG